MLIFFHLYWFDIKQVLSIIFHPVAEELSIKDIFVIIFYLQDITDHSSYLSKMSTLLNVYIDMELKTSDHVRDSSKIAARIFAALYIYLSECS